MAFDCKMYFSGSMSPHKVPSLLTTNVHRLFTYAYPKEVYEYLDYADELGVRCTIMMDSGAFTSWSIGRPVVLQELIDHNKAVMQRYSPRHEFVFISLDVIPGERGRSATEAEINQAVSQSYHNFVLMQKEFPDNYVLPVYHSGEELGLRNAYYDLTDYICLSMNQNMSERDRVLWAKRVIDNNFKHHGLAATGNRMLSDVKWYSVDSSGWLMVAAMGCILWRSSDNKGLHPLSISHDSPNTKSAGRHFDTLTKMEQDKIRAIVLEQGFQIEDLRIDYAARMAWNIRQWNDPPWDVVIQPPNDLFEGLA